jgi:3-hydroxybutyryl-CoA dehydratase
MGIESIQFQRGQRASLAKTITEADVRTYAELIGDRNPLHTDEEFARRSRFGRRTVHSTFSGDLVSAVLGNQLPGPGSVYLSQQTEFLAPIYLGDTITATVEVISWRPDKRIITLKTDCHKQDDTQVVTGKAVLLVDPAE